MTCIADTASINLTVAAGQLSADLIVDPGAGLAPNLVTVNPAGVYVIGSDGWIPLPVTLAFSSADAPTFVATTSVDLRSFIGPGDKIRLVQSGVPAYFFVTAITAGLITLYGGTLYTLAALPISTPYFSKVKSPIGFSLDPTVWTVLLRDTTDRSQASPVSGTWYNIGSLSIVIPIGIWKDVRYSVAAASNVTPAGSIYATLSTTNNGESDVDLTSFLNSVGGGIFVTLAQQKTLVLAVKTTYFLNAKTSRAGSSDIEFDGSSVHPTIIRATTAYL